MTEPYVDERPLVYRFRYLLLGGHVHVRMFAGRNPHALGLAGTPIFRPDEWEGLQAVLAAGYGHLLETGDGTEHVRVEFVDDTPPEDRDG